MYGDKEGSSEEAGSKENSSEEDRKEKISKVVANFGLENYFSSLFFCLRSSIDMKLHFSKKFKINL